MFGHRSFLVIGGDSVDLIVLLKGGIEISNSQFSFIQDVDDKGKATTKVYGGVIEITISQLPPMEIIEWGMKSRKYLNGTIITLDNENMPLEKIYFENAACVDLEVEYNAIGESYSNTKFCIQAEKMIVGRSVEFSNEWVY